MINSYQPPVSVIIPAYNEAGAIFDQIEIVRKHLSENQFEYEIIVIDDGSSDNTADRAVEGGARVLRHPENCGYGMALKTGIQAAIHDVIVIIDADGTYPAYEIPEIIQKLEHADMVVGARTGSQVHTSLSRRPAKWFLRKLAERIAEQPIPDLNSGLRAFRKDCARQYFSILSNRFSFTTTITLAYLADGYRVLYHSINYFPRIGQSKIVPWHFMDFTILIIRMSMMFNPLKIFVPLAFTFGFLGLVKMVYDIFAVFARSGDAGWSLLLQPVLSTSAVLLLFVGLQLMVLGMVADGVIRRIGQMNRRQVPSHGYVNYELTGRGQPSKTN